MVRPYLALLAAVSWPGVVSGQNIFQGLAATDSGRLFFSRNPNFATLLRIRGAEPPNNGSLFSYSPSDGITWGPGSGIADVSADGRVLGLSEPHTAFDCPTAKTCHLATIYTGTIITPGMRWGSLAGRVQVSRNGRFALVTAQDGKSAARIDLANGAVLIFPGAVAAVRQAISGDGTVVLLDRGQVILHGDGGDRRLTNLPSTYPASSAIIDDAGDRVLYVSLTGIHAIDVATASDAPLVEGSAPVISADGQTILYLARTPAPQVFVLSSGAVRQLTFLDDDVTEVALSADGSTAYAATFYNRVVRVDIQSGAVAAIVPRTPVIVSFQNIGAAGSLVSAYGGGFADAGLHIRWGQLDAPLLYADTAMVRFQIPFEAAGDGTLTLESASSIYQEWPLAVQEFFPEFLTLSEAGSQAIHQDFRSVVTPASPAIPGEAIHLYATGFGPVSPPVSTGKAAPSAPPAVITTRISCMLSRYNVGFQPAPVLFAGLAPGLTGVYQLDVLLPDSDGPDALAYTTLRCGNEERAATGGIWIRTLSRQ